MLRLADAAWAACGWARTTREVVGGYRVEAERNFGLGARASGTRRRESASWVNRAGEIPRGDSVEWRRRQGTNLLEIRVGLFGRGWSIYMKMD